ncbi:MAG: DUF504 domain-containing protein [Thermoplasmata archaeon]
MKTVRSVLNELKWRPGTDFSKVTVEYVHRGAPGNIASISGGDIISLEPWMMVVRRPGASPANGAPGPGRVAIPYHRVVRVSYNGKVVMERGSGMAKGGEGGAVARDAGESIQEGGSGGGGAKPGERSAEPVETRPAATREEE